MGSRDGCEKSAAKRSGLSVEEWRARRAEGIRRCFRCREWVRLEDFSADQSRESGRSHSCKACTSLASTASRYGLGAKALRVMLREANGRCALCKRESKKLVVDHDHASGAVRGLLCSACNTGMGLLGDNPNLLRIAAQYLEANRG